MNVNALHLEIALDRDYHFHYVEQIFMYVIYLLVSLNMVKNMILQSHMKEN